MLGGADHRYKNFILSNIHNTCCFIFYLALIYRPMRLLDRMLSNIASDLPDALFLYDPIGSCIWANDPAKKLTRIKDNELDQVSTALTNILGKKPYETTDWEQTRVIGTGADAKYYTIENHGFRDENKQLAGLICIRV